MPPPTSTRPSTRPPRNREGIHPPGRRDGPLLLWFLLALFLLALLTAPEATGLRTPPGVVRSPDEPAGPGRLTPGDVGFELDVKDQHGGRIVYPLSDERLNADGSAPVTLVVWAGRRGADARRGWTEALRGRYREQLERETRPGLVVLPVAHLPNVPGPLRGFIVRRHFNDRPPTGLDWQQTVAEQLGFEPSTTNLAVLAPDGRLVARFSGDPTDVNRQHLFRILDSLLSPASPDAEALRGGLRK